MKTTEWRAYHELAWTEPIIAPPGEYAGETEQFCKIIKDYSKTGVKTLLHLGCGAGGNDYTFKRHFQVTGVDISEEMLAIARKLNPEVAYYTGDMRTVELSEEFDAVAIPDSIGYMTTLIDLRNLLSCAFRHLKPDGTLLIAASTAEQFKENNFVYSGSKGDIEVTVFENNHILRPAGTIYEAVLIYLIRDKGKLDVYTDCHQLGLFKLEVWLKLLNESGFGDINQIALDNLYHDYIVGEGEYPQTIFVCRRR